MKEWMNMCRNDSKKKCLLCRHFYNCSIANKCNGECWDCDITECNSNPQYVEGEIDDGF